MADVKVPALLHKMSKAAQKAWYKKNKMSMPQERSVAQAKKIKPVESKPAAVATVSDKPKTTREINTERQKAYYAKGGRAPIGAGGSGGHGAMAGAGQSTIKDIKAGIKAGFNPKVSLDPYESEKAKKVGPRSLKIRKEEVKMFEGYWKEIDTERKETERLAAQEKEPPFTPDKKKIRRGSGGEMSHAKWLAKQAMMKKMKSMKEDAEPVLEQDDTMEKKEMAQTQLHFIGYAAKEILEFIEMGGEIEEWYQNKLSKVQSEVESLHSYIEGEKRRTGMVKEEEHIEEKAPPGAKYERMVKHIKKGYKEGGLTDKEKSIAYATAWKAYNKANEEVEQEVESVDEKYMGFKAVMAAAKKGGARDPAAVAASIGRKKYGKEKFQAMAAAGKKKANEETEVVAEAEGKVAVTPKEKELAAHHGDPTRITYGDVIKARLKSAAAKKMGK